MLENNLNVDVDFSNIFTDFYAEIENNLINTTTSDNSNNISNSSIQNINLNTNHLKNASKNHIFIKSREIELCTDISQEEANCTPKVILYKITNPSEKVIKKINEPVVIEKNKITKKVSSVQKQKNTSEVEKENQQKIILNDENKSFKIGLLDLALEVHEIIASDSDEEVKLIDVDNSQDNQESQQGNSTIKKRKRRKKAQLDEIKSELTKIREQNGIEVWEIAEKLGYRKQHYKTVEMNNGYTSSNKNELFINRFFKAIEEIKNERIQLSSQPFSCMKANKKGILEEHLIYPPLTEDVYQQAISIMKNKNKNVIQVSVMLGIDDEELQKRLSQDSKNSYLITKNKD